MLSDDEKIKCVELYRWATGNDTRASQWNESAADLLAEMYAKTVTCSRALSFVPKPSGSKPGWGWVINYAYSAVSYNPDKIFDICRVACAYSDTHNIETALVTGGM